MIHELCKSVTRWFMQFKPVMVVNPLIGATSLFKNIIWAQQPEFVIFCSHILCFIYSFYSDHMCRTFTLYFHRALLTSKCFCILEDQLVIASCFLEQPEAWSNSSRRVVGQQQRRNQMDGPATTQVRMSLEVQCSSYRASPEGV